MKCSVCQKTILGKPHDAPEGVFLCSKACFEEWKQKTKLGEVVGNFLDKLVKALDEYFKEDLEWKLHTQPPKEYLEMRAQRKAHYEWVQRYEESVTQYIR